LHRGDSRSRYDTRHVFVPPVATFGPTLTTSSGREPAWRPQQQSVGETERSGVRADTHGEQRTAISVKPGLRASCRARCEVLRKPGNIAGG
jgi:hypothetical protein